MRKPLFLIPKRHREFKSNSFSLLLKQPKYALEVYNLLNETEYKDPNLIQILDVEGGIGLTVRNDAAFIIDSNLSIYEHQSTINPNMPLRLLIYISSLYKELVREENIYGEGLIMLPTPKFVVFYNGEKEWGGVF